jgi:SWI/SNF-related matrix-associated actin-dependent regulator 1 of chromatin subfamily A
LLLLLLLLLQAPAGGLTEAIRASRRAKLAELLTANPKLTGCTLAAAADVAAALEATAAAAPGTTAAQHRAAVVKLAAAVKAANGWLQLPRLQQLSGQGLIVVLQAAVQDVAAAGNRLEGDGENEEQQQTAAEVEQQLLQLAQLPVTVAALEATGVARQVKVLKKHQQQQVAAAAGKVISAWRAAVSSS